jgi:ABC-type multidrug transport system ATPase subunit
MSILDDMSQIRKVMGVCPQHDVLWDQLTGRYLLLSSLPFLFSLSFFILLLL